MKKRHKIEGVLIRPMIWTTKFDFIRLYNVTNYFLILVFEFFNKLNLNSKTIPYWNPVHTLGPFLLTLFPSYSFYFILSTFFVRHSYDNIIYYGAITRSVFNSVHIRYTSIYNNGCHRDQIITMFLRAWNSGFGPKPYNNFQ